MNMSEMFMESSFNGDISKWNTSRATDMSAMFWHSQFNSDISQWDVSKVTDMSHMFTSSEFKGDLRPWHLTEMQMEEAFKHTFPNYLTIRQNIEGAEKLHATFGGSTPRVKKVL
jgi:surface protein